MWGLIYHQWIIPSHILGSRYHIDGYTLFILFSSIYYILRRHLVPIAVLLKYLMPLVECFF